MKNAGNWFNYDVKFWLEDNNKLVDTFISNGYVSPEALEAKRQYIPNCILIPSMMVGAKLPDIYNYAPLPQDSYDSPEGDDINDMPIHKQDGVDYADIVNDARAARHDAKVKYDEAKAIYEKVKADSKAKTTTEPVPPEVK